MPAMKRWAWVLVGITGCGDAASAGDAATADGGLDAASVIDAATLDAATLDAVNPDAASPDAGPVVLTSTVNFAADVGSLCGLAFDRTTDTIWLHPCSGASIHAFSTAGVAGGTVARPGEAANDVDVTVAPEALTLGVNTVAEGDLILINGETGVGELYLPESNLTTPLATGFGDSHVVGGSYHPGRDSFFLVQDRVPATSPNTVAELDRVTGVVLSSFSTLPAFDVNYGDLEVCPENGHLFLVSSNETTLAEFSPTGEFLAEHALPGGVSDASGLGFGAAGQAWVSGTGGTVFRLDGVPCGN